MVAATFRRDRVMFFVIPIVVMALQGSVECIAEDEDGWLNGTCYAKPW